MTKQSNRNLDQQPPVKYSRLNLDVALLIALLPVIAAATRIWVYSGGDTTVFLLLLRTLEISSVLVATIVLLIPTILITTLIVILTDWKARDRIMAWKNNNEWAVPIFPFVALVLIYTLDLWIFVALLSVGLMSVAYLLIERFWPWGRKNLTDILIAKRGNNNGPDSQITMLSAIIIFMLMPVSMWLPLEAVAADDGKHYVAYVLESDSEWTTMLSEDRHIDVIPTSSVESRGICRAHGSSSIARLVLPSRTNDAPNCEVQDPLPSEK